MCLDPKRICGCLRFLCYSVMVLVEKAYDLANSKCVTKYRFICALSEMAFELYGMLAGNVSPTTGESIKPAYGGEEEAFLRKVVTPIYNTIAKEAKWSKGGKSKHSQWRNYDDLNEYFWSIDCFRLGWPMRADSDFFCQPIEQLRDEKKMRCPKDGPGQIEELAVEIGLRFVNRMSHQATPDVFESRSTGFDQGSKTFWYMEQYFKVAVRAPVNG
ncbi:unnamed protein product [Ilex paraguariensis]|uniref:1,3-beta-glucan synthase component FKS1-like domain-containing protein n=1 Tax=Ilex paraguariensis TaxID=185542 RepID=A0ABC8UDW2_9AQUA